MAQRFPIELVSSALKAGWTRERVVLALLAKIQRDQKYLAYRQRTGRHTSFDEITEADLPVLALAASWLSEDTTSEADQPN